MPSQIEASAAHFLLDSHSVRSGAASVIVTVSCDESEDSTIFNRLQTVGSDVIANIPGVAGGSEDVIIQSFLPSDKKLSRRQSCRQSELDCIGWILMQ